jgi:hypothetical protein
MGKLAVNLVDRLEKLWEASMELLSIEKLNSFSESFNPLSSCRISLLKRFLNLPELQFSFSQKTLSIT